MFLENAIIKFNQVASSGHRKSLRGNNKREFVIFLEKLAKDIRAQAPMFAQACDCVLENLQSGESKKLAEATSSLNIEDRRSLLAHIANLEEAISAVFKGYTKLSQSTKPNQDLANQIFASRELESIDFDMIKLFSPTVHDDLLKLMDDTGVIKVLKDLQSDPLLANHEPEQRESKIYQLYDFNERVRTQYLKSKTIPVIVKSQIQKILHNLSTLGENVHARRDFVRDTDTSSSIAKYFLDRNIQFFDQKSSHIVNSVINPVFIRQKLQESRNNHLMRGIAKLGVTAAASVMSIVLAVSSMPTKPEAPRPTVPATEEIVEPEDAQDGSLERDSEASDATLQSSKINSPQSPHKSGMEGNRHMKSGELGEGALVYTARPIGSTQRFLINFLTHYHGDEQVSSSEKLGQYHGAGKVLQTISLAKNNYQAGEKINLLLDPTDISGIGDIRMSKSCSYSLSGNILTINTAVDELEIEYDICSIAPDTIFNTFSVNKDFHPKSLPPEAMNLINAHRAGSENFSPEATSRYLSGFNYLVSSEIQRLIQRMPGLQERNLSFLRIGDCDMLSDHLAWLLQGQLPCGVGIGYIDDNGDGKVYATNAHAQFMYQNPSRQLSNFESTAPVKAAYIIPDHSFKSQDLEVLEKIVNQIKVAQTQADRDLLMRVFGNKLDEILQSPHYQQFVSKNGSNPALDSLSKRENNPAHNSLSKRENDSELDSLSQQKNDSELDSLSKQENNPAHNSLSQRENNSELDSLSEQENDSELDSISKMATDHPLYSLSVALGVIYSIGTSSLVLRSKKSRDQILQQYYPFIKRDGETSTLVKATLLLPPMEAGRLMAETVFMPLDRHEKWNERMRSEFFQNVNESTRKLGRSSLPLRNLLSNLGEKHRAPVAYEGLEKFFKRIRELAASMAPPYRPLWDQITNELEDLTNNGRITRTAVLDLARRHFEAAPLRKNFLENMESMLDDLCSVPNQTYFKGIEQLSKSIQNHMAMMPGKFEGSRSSNKTGGTEFHSHANYQFGDDLRRVDWKATGRHPDRPYQIKKYTDSSSASKVSHSITVVVDTQTVAENYKDLEGLVTLLRLCMMKNSAINLKVHIYSCGELVDQIGDKEIKLALSTSSNQSDALRNILKSILRRSAQEAIFSPDSNQLSSMSLQALDPAYYQGANIWGGNVEDLLDKLQGRCNPDNPFEGGDLLKVPLLHVHSVVIAQAGRRISSISSDAATQGIMVKGFLEKHRRRIDYPLSWADFYLKQCYQRMGHSNIN